MPEEPDTFLILCYARGEPLPTHQIPNHTVRYVARSYHEVALLLIGQDSNLSMVPGICHGEEVQDQGELELEVDDLRRYQA